MTAKILMVVIFGVTIFAVAQMTVPAGNPADPVETTPSAGRAAVPGGGKMQNHQSFTNLPSPEPAWTGRMTNPANPNGTNSYGWMTNSTGAAVTNQNNWWWKQ